MSEQRFTVEDFAPGNSGDPHFAVVDQERCVIASGYYHDPVSAQRRADDMNAATIAEGRP